MPSLVVDSSTIPGFLLIVAAILVAAKFAGEVAERMGQPAVLGELVAGVFLGRSVLGLVNPAAESIHLLSELGVIILLFAIGLETDLRRLLRAGAASSVVAITGVVLPFALGYAVAAGFGAAPITAVVIGAAMTATSVGITARVFGDLGTLGSAEGQIVLGAAVIDDVLGLVILAIVAQVIEGGSTSVGAALIITAKAFGFLVGIIALGSVVVPRLFVFLERVGKPATLAPLALALAFVFAALADAAGSALIVGAFAAGLVLAPTPQARAIEQGVGRLGHFFVPVFFVSVGAAVDLWSFASVRVLLLGTSLIAVAVLGKFMAGYAPFWFKGRKNVIGVGMIPRGEVGLIFAQMGLTQGVLAAGEFGAVMLMVMATTFIAPPLLKMLLAGEMRTGTRVDNAIADLTNEA